MARQRKFIREIKKGLEEIDMLMDVLERRRWGRGVVVLLVGVVLMMMALVYVVPGVEFGMQGGEYARLSKFPFDLSLNSRLQYRMLSPILGYGLGLRGDNFRFLPVLMGTLFLSMVYYYARREKLSRGDSVGIATMMALSVTVGAVLNHPGFVDTTSYLLLALVLISIRQLWLWPIFYLLLIFNHERNLVTVPWVYWWMLMNVKKLKYYIWSLGLLGVTVAILFWWRDHVAASGYEIEYTIDFYLNPDNFNKNSQMLRGWAGLGAFGSFRLFWVWPVYAIYRLVQIKEKRMMALWLAAVIAAAGLQLLVAHDSSRLMGLAWPAIVIGALEVRKLWGARVFRRRLWMLIGASLLMPNYMMLGPWYVAFYSVPVALIYKWLLNFNVMAYPWIWF